MNIALIGRSEVLYNTAESLLAAGHKIKLIVTAKEAPEYTKSSDDFKSLAGEIGAKYLYAPSVNASGLKSYLDGIDIGISYNYVNVISKEVIDLFPYGILNAHGGDLPRYRGNACQAWAIINRESQIGLCIHKMVEALDAGDVIVKAYHPVDIDTKVGVLLSWIEQQVPKMFLEAISLLKENKDYVFYSQSKKSEDILRCYPRKPADGRIRWEAESADIIRLINASNKPYAGAFSFYGEQQVIIWDASLGEDNENFLAVPGQVTAIDRKSGAIEVAAGNGKVKVKSIEVEGQLLTPANLIKSMRDRLS